MRIPALDNAGEKLAVVRVVIIAPRGLILVERSKAQILLAEKYSTRHLIGQHTRLLLGCSLDRTAAAGRGVARFGTMGRIDVV